MAFIGKPAARVVRGNVDGGNLDRVHKSQVPPIFVFVNIRHSSFVIFHFSFSTFHFPLSTFHFPLFIFHFSFSTFHFSLFIFHFSFFIFHFSFSTFHFPLSTFHFSLFTFHFSFFTFPRRLGVNKRICSPLTRLAFSLRTPLGVSKSVCLLFVGMGGQG